MRRTGRMCCVSNCFEIAGAGEDGRVSMTRVLCFSAFVDVVPVSRDAGTFRHVPAQERKYLTDNWRKGKAVKKSSL